MAEKKGGGENLRDATKEVRHKRLGKVNGNQKVNQEENSLEMELNGKRKLNNRIIVV